MDNAQLYNVLAKRVNPAAPKLLAAVADYVNGDGGAPDEVVTVRLLERFGWTPAQLDEVDVAELFPAIAASNIADAMHRVRAWIDAAGRGQKVSQPPEADWIAWKVAYDAKKNRG